MAKGKPREKGVEKVLERVAARLKRELNIVVKRAEEREVHRGKRGRKSITKVAAKCRSLSRAK